jgi:DNA repair protein RadC
MLYFIAKMDNLNSGHRKRMREDVLKNGAQSLGDYELLEMVLFLANPRHDQRHLAKILLIEFKSISGILGTNINRLQQVPGIGASAASIIKVLHELFCRAMREKITDTPLLNNQEKVMEYCKMRMAYSAQEEFRILFLNKKNFLITDEVQQVGTIDQTSIYPREVVKRVIELGASAIIMTHNHPSGDSTPSKADIVITKQVQSALTTIGVKVHDHIVIAKNGHFSMRINGLLDIRIENMIAMESD